MQNRCALHIGIAGFHETAFVLAPVNRTTSQETRAAIDDLPCRIKMVEERNISEGLLLAQRMLGGYSIGRRGIILITSGDSPARRERIENAAEAAAMKGIGIHVICLGPKVNDPCGGPRIDTRAQLGYGGFRVAHSVDELRLAVHRAFEGLMPRPGARGINEAVVLLDCSEAMVEAFQGSTRVEFVMASLEKFVNECGNFFNPAAKVNQHRHYGPGAKPQNQSARHSQPAIPYEWSPGQRLPHATAA